MRAILNIDYLGRFFNRENMETGMFEIEDRDYEDITGECSLCKGRCFPEDIGYMGPDDFGKGCSPFQSFWTLCFECLDKLDRIISGMVEECEKAIY